MVALREGITPLIHLIIPEVLKVSHDKISLLWSVWIFHVYDASDWSQELEHGGVEFRTVLVTGKMCGAVIIVHTVDVTTDPASCRGCMAFAQTY